MTSNPHGLTVKGDVDQFIIDGNNLPLTQRYKGPLIITHVLRTTTNVQGWIMGYGYCVVTYPSPVRTDLPPLVFAVPTDKANNNGLGFFYHVGTPGNWTGFSVLITPSLFATNGSTHVGYDSGWTYRVCVLGDPGLPPSGETHGLIVNNEAGVKVFDSRWPLVPFRGLLGKWTHHSYTRSYNWNYYWGYRSLAIKWDAVLIRGTHPWGANHNTLGFLLSGMGCVPSYHDVGDTHITTTAVVTMGFSGPERDTIWAVAYQGFSQHPAGDVTAMNRWNLLTADFSYV